MVVQGRHCYSEYNAKAMKKLIIMAHTLLGRKINRYMVYCAVKCIAYIDCNEDTTFKSRMFITHTNEVYETKLR